MSRHFFPQSRMVPSFFCFVFHDISLLEDTSYKEFHILDLPDSSLMIRLRVSIFSEYYIGDVYFSLHYIKRYMSGCQSLLVMLSLIIG